MILSGTRLWYQQWGTSTDNFGYGVKVDGTAIVYVTGPTYEYLPGETGNTDAQYISLEAQCIRRERKFATILYGTENYSDYVEGIALDRQR